MILISSFKRGALATTIGVMKPRMDIDTKFHPTYVGLSNFGGIVHIVIGLFIAISSKFFYEIII